MNTATKTETLNGGMNFPVQLKNGTKAELFVRQLPARRMADYLKAQDDEAAMIELACALGGKPVLPEFVDDLTDESHESLVAEIERINNDFFLKWGRRQRARAEKLKAALVGEAQSASPTSLPNPQSSAA
jgi:hypothetical protein